MAAIRTFISINLPEELKREISQLQDRLRMHGSHVGWVRPESLHLTLRFLGDVDEKEISEIEGVVREAAKGFDPFYIKFVGLGVFPDLKRPRIIWLGVMEGGDNLFRLQLTIKEGIAKIGYPREERGFKPHLTIGRVRDIHGLKSLIDAIEAEKEVDLDGFNVTGISIMRSDLRPGGAVYTRLSEIGF